MDSPQIIKFLWNAGSAIFGFSMDKMRAERIYQTIVPFVQDALRQGVIYEDPDIQRAVETLATLPPFGARARNFKKKYLGSGSGLLSLPENPQRIPYGYWW